MGGSGEVGRTVGLADHALGEHPHLGDEPSPTETEEHGIVGEPRAGPGLQQRHDADRGDLGLDVRSRADAVRADCPGQQNDLLDARFPAQRFNGSVDAGGMSEIDNC